MPRSQHPARRARRIVALASSASYLGLTASIAVATTVSNESDDVAANVPSTAPDPDALAFELQGAAAPVSSTTLVDPEPTSVDLFETIDETLAPTSSNSSTTATPGSTQPPATTAVPNTPTTPGPTTAPPTAPAPTTAPPTTPPSTTSGDTTTTLQQTTTTQATATTADATTTTQATTTTTQAATTTTQATTATTSGAS